MNAESTLPWAGALLAEGRAWAEIGSGVYSTVPDEPGSTYDRVAAAYDRLVTSTIYNRAVWGTSPSVYSDFAISALTSGDGPLLDVACGTAVFTAAAYRVTPRRLVLADRSSGMLERAATRFPGGPDPSRVSLVQADLLDLPFRPASFETVTCHGLLHVLDDIAPVFRALQAQAVPGGTLYATSLVGETVAGRAMLGLLHRVGEAAPPRRAAEVAAVARAVWGEDTQARIEGCMLFLTAQG